MRELAKEIAGYAGQAAAGAIKAIQEKPKDIAGHRRLLSDLKYSLCEEAASLTKYTSDAERLWAFAHDFPDFETCGLYRARAALPALAAAVFLGWLLGGILATALGFLGLGGEILRPCAILACLWLEEYLGSNPRARRILLTVLGLGALGRFAAALAAGMVRFGGIRQLIFGGAARPNIFKSLWLWFGAFFLYVFFAKKISGLDAASFQTDLAGQIRQRLELACLIFTELRERDATLALLEGSAQAKGGAACANNSCQLALAVLSILDSLDSGKRRYLESCLGQMGFNILDNDEAYLIWDEQSHPQKYNLVGMAANGDRCRILERPHETGGKLVKGLAQRVSL